MPSPGSCAPAPDPRHHRLRRAAGLGAAAVLGLAVLTACGGDDDAAAEPTTSPSPSASSPTASASPTSSPTAEESETTTPSPEPSDDPTVSPGPTEATETGGQAGGQAGGGGTLRDALLVVSDVPGLSSGTSWQQGRTQPVGTAAFGWCSRVDALSIGADQGVERQFPSAVATDRAAQQVLDVVDETNAGRVEQTFRGWHRDCGGRDGTRVGPIRELSVPSGQAWWYVSERPTQGGQWEAFGLARVGERVTVLRMQHAGPDHSYPAGQDPLERALRTAAGKLA